MNNAHGAALALVFALLVAGYLVQSRLPPPRPKIIGIDLGTTFSAVGTYESKSGNVTVYKDSNGKYIIPSVVAILDTDILVGHKAVEQIEQNSKNTIFDAKRFIGKKFTHDQILKLTSNYGFSLDVDENDNPLFRVSLSDRDQLFTPEEVGSIILQRLKAMAEKSIERNIDFAVMSVPADFNNEQRNATMKAAQIAGLRVLRLINEPTAAALAYGLHKKEGTNNVIVIDFGGGTLDVSLLMIQGGMFITTAMAGNNRLGGQDVNNNLIDFFRQMIRKKFGVQLKSANDLQKVRDEVEKLKIGLTDFEEATFSVNLETVSADGKPIEFLYTLSRTEFNNLNAAVFKKFLKPIERVLIDGNIDKKDVDEIVMVGGSTLIPQIRKLTQEYFQKLPNYSIDPDIAVVIGTAVQANIASNGWPLKVSAIEIQNDVKKVNVVDEE